MLFRTQTGPEILSSPPLTNPLFGYMNPEDKKQTRTTPHPSSHSTEDGAWMALLCWGFLLKPGETRAQPGPGGSSLALQDSTIAVIHGEGWGTRQGEV